MKNIIYLLALLMLQTASGFTGIAQKTSMYAQSTTQLQLEKNSILVENFSFADVLGAENRIQHTAVFTIPVNSDAATQKILRLLQAYTKEQASRQLLFTNINHTGAAIEERFYDNVIVEDIVFNELDATSRTPFRATVRIRAGVVKLQKGGTNNGAIKSKSSQAFSSNFSVTVGNLPTARVTKISGLSIKPNAGQYQHFTIEVLATDGAAWNQWFLTGAGGIKKEQGFIRLLSPNMKDELYLFSLADIEIVSYSSTPSTQNGIGRATIGLRMNSMFIK